jgi:hypothetical protein
MACGMPTYWGWLRGSSAFWCRTTLGPHHFRDFVATQRSPGVFLISQDLQVGAAVEALLLIADASEAEEWENHLTYLPL